MLFTIIITFISYRTWKALHYYELLSRLDFMVIIVFLFQTHAKISSDIRNENSLKTWDLLEADKITPKFSHLLFVQLMNN